MEVKFEKVFERDVDLLLINSFINNEAFFKKFINKFGLTGYELVSLEHSLSDNDGESDVTIILTDGNNKIALLIEDKIDAIAMPKQRDRYNLRGNKGVEKGFYDKYYVSIVAPQSYLDTNVESKKYEYRISYEELIEMFGNDTYAVSILKQAIEEKKKGYVIVEDKNVTLFWQNYYEYVEENFPDLIIRRYDGPRGANAWWPGFILPIKGTKIDYKSDRGFVDLSLDGLGEYYYEVSNLLDDKLEHDMSLVRTGKSLSIRIKVPIVHFNEEFSNYIDEIDISLIAVKRLSELLKKIDVKELFNIKN